MASLARRNGSHILQFAYAGRRRTCSLGRLSQTEAEAVRLNVSRLTECYDAGIRPDATLAAWTAMTAGRLRKCLVEAGLADQTVTVAEYLDAELKRSATPARQRIADGIRAMLGTRQLSTLTTDDGQRVRDAMTGGPNTINGKLTAARGVFRRAVKRGLLTVNPFDEIAGERPDNTQRKQFVTREEIDAVMDQTADPELRLIIALGRYAGLRIPSELFGLKWSDIDWSNQRFTITSDTKRNLSRVVPIFPELAGPLSEAHTAAPEGVDDILHRYRDKSLSRILVRLVRRAGLVMWPKPWHSLRASRETELIERFPIFVVCQWIGNSPQVALRHYLMVREAHYESATEPLPSQPSLHAPESSPSLF